MGLITKTVIVKWHPNNKKWYESKGHVFTKWKDEFEVRVEDLSERSGALVDICCDGCGEILKEIPWGRYKQCVHKDNKYYCILCAKILFGNEKQRETKLKNSISFYDWCYLNLSKELADYILSKWDYELNIINGKPITPKNVSYSSKGINGEGYWFKCLDNLEHFSELRSIKSLTSGRMANIVCNQCNTISMTHPESIKFLVNPKDSLKHSQGSLIKLPMKCPDCGFEKSMAISTLINQGFGCNKCSDHIPYTEKFVFCVFEQLNYDFKTQANKTILKWSKNYKYDFYISNKTPMIIETHGMQHYEYEVGWKQSLEEIQDNDFDKEWLARENGINKYIILDCRKSELEWIKNSIMSSILPKLLNFKEDDIDWLKCHEFSCKNLVKEVCSTWNSGVKSVPKLKIIFKLGKTTLIKYLNKGTKLGWCDYNGQEEKMKNYNSRLEKNGVKIICITTNKIFNSQLEASQEYGICSDGISHCCNKEHKTSGLHPESGQKLIWMFYDEYLIKNKENGWRENYIKDCNIDKTKVICLLTSEIFNSTFEAENKYNIHQGSISKCCRGKKKSAGKHPDTGEKLVWMYYDDYILLNSN